MQRKAIARWRPGIQERDQKATAVYEKERPWTPPVRLQAPCPGRLCRFSCPGSHNHCVPPHGCHLQSICLLACDAFGTRGTCRAQRVEAPCQGLRAGRAAAGVEKRLSCSPLHMTFVLSTCWWGDGSRPFPPRRVRGHASLEDSRLRPQPLGEKRIF